MTIEQLSARVEKLERANRRWRAWGVGALVLLAAGVAMGQAAPEREIITADGFEVRGLDGKALATLDIVGLTLFDIEGKRHAMFGLDPTGSPMLVLYDHEGKMRADFGLLANDSSQLNLRGPDGNPRARIGVDGDGTPGLALSGKEGKVVFQAPQK